MVGKSIESMDEAELLRNVALLGPPPVLSTEDAKAFEEIFRRLAACFKVRDMLMLQLTREYTSNSWFIRRYTYHSAVAIERWHRRYREGQVEVAMFKKAQKEKQVLAKATDMSRTPADIAHLVALENKIDDTVSDVDAILARKPTELEHNLGLEKTAQFQEQLDRLLNSATRRRNDAYHLLEIYRAGLGQAVQETADKILDAEFAEIKEEAKDQISDQKDGPNDQPEANVAPSIIPTKDESSNDLEPQNRSEPAQ
jgi:hypothetical protein